MSNLAVILGAFVALLAFSYVESAALHESLDIVKTRIKRVDPKEKKFNQWGGWCDCSVTCGEGSQYRERTYRKRWRGPKDPEKELREDRACSPGPCAEWGLWTEWTSCSVTCASGTRYRNRFCNLYSGCEGQAKQQEVCSKGECAEWAQWNPWGQCSKLCGGGVRTRTRQCSGYGTCPGDDTDQGVCETRPCCASWTGFGPCSATCVSYGAEAPLQKNTRLCTEDTPSPTYASRTEEKTRPCEPTPPSCATWNPWGPWADCSATCGGGEKVRKRTCTEPGQCTGSDTSAERCNPEDCPTWHDWGEWSPCSASCGGGTKKRTRVCTQGDLCEGDATEEVPCNEGVPCPEWNEWFPWEPCSASCGGGFQVRERVCSQTALCSGDPKEKRVCNDHDCPFMGPWGPWGDCSGDCGQGHVKERQRQCQIDKGHCTVENMAEGSCQCAGDTEESEPCHTHECAHWEPWAEWSACTDECDGGERSRTRKCKSDVNFCVGANKDHPSCVCEGDADETEPCNSHTCAAWSEWNAWADCSATCGGGQKTRERVCNKDEAACVGELANSAGCTCEGLASETDVCNTHQCPAWDEWTTWGHEATGGDCSVECGGGVQQRERTCQVDTTYCVGDKLDTDPSCQCVGEDSGEQPCNEFDCPVWNEWSEWSTCSVTCTTGTQERKRTCKPDPNHCVGATLTKPECQCEGEDTSTQECDMGPCVSWGTWEAWGECSRVCGGGSRTRTRKCPQPGACPGLATATAFCNQIPCPDWGLWGGWSSCSDTCGGGTMVRTRTCPIDGGCTPGDSWAVQDCNTDACPQWVQWAEWGSCSVTCDTGNRKRVRSCVKAGVEVDSDGCLGRGEDVEACKLESCPLNTFWSDWSPCTQTCATGTRVRSKLSCPSPSCPTQTEREECSPQECPSWAAWQSWSECSRTCGKGSRNRARVCTDPKSGAEVKHGCVGLKSEGDPNGCNDFAC